MEKTCTIIKPDGVCKNHIGSIIERFESEHLKVIGLKMLKPERKMLEGFYKMHIGKPFFEPFMNFMLSGPIVVLALEGENAISSLREILGPTNSKEAPPGTLRGKFGTDNRRNLVHGSDSLESAKREIAFFFSPNEIYSYNRDDWQD